MTGLEWQRVMERYDEQPEAFDYADEDAAHTEIGYGIDEGLATFTARTPGQSWAYIDVDCFGGTCLYDGFIARDGERQHSLSGASQRGHLELLEHLGATGLTWDFAPFHRAFLEGRSPATDELRREIQGVVQGSLSGLPLESLRLRLPLALPFPWKANSMGARTLMLESGDQDLWLSITAEESSLRLGGRCHVPPETAKTSLDDLVSALQDSGCELKLSLLTLDRVLLHRWERGAT